MKRSSNVTWIVLALVLMGCMAFSGCGSDSSTSSGTSVNVAGTWAIVATGYSPMTAILTHSGTSITGTVSSLDGTATSISGTSETPANAVSRNITLNVQFVHTDWSASIVMTGTINDANTSMSGDYIDNSGGLGTWSATLQ